MTDFLDLLDDGPKKKRKLNGDVVHHILEHGTGKGGADNGMEEDGGSEEETADEKRLRMAQEYLQKLASVQDEENIDEDLIASRLKEDAAKLRGKRFQSVAYQLTGKKLNPPKIVKGHQGAPTCVATSADAQHAITGAKDGSIVKWSLPDCKKIYTIQSLPKKLKRQHTAHTNNDNTLNKHEHHAGGILSVAISADGKYLATGGEDRNIIIRDFQSGKFIKKFQGHRGGVTGLCFVEGPNSLYSCSMDRTVKVWGIDEMSYVDTLFGHQSEALAISLLSAANERCVTAGRDQTVRVWKVAEEKQLLFKAGAGNIDSLAVMSGEVFVTATDNGRIDIWNSAKKKPVSSAVAHTGGALAGVGAAAAIPNTDLLATGASDGAVQLWCVGATGTSIEPVTSVRVDGFVNGATFAGNLLVVAVGREPRLGRWAVLPNVRNGIAVIPLPLQLPQ